MIVRAASRIHDVSEYFFVKKLEDIRKLKDQGHDVINFGIGSPDLPPSEETIRALQHTAGKPDTHGYQNYRGIPELRRAMSKWYESTYGVSLDPESEIMPLAGSKEGIMHISMAFLDPGDHVLVPDPGYPTYRAIAGLMEAKIRTYDVTDDTQGFPDIERLGRMPGLDKVKLMWLNYPHMPTGTPPDQEKLREIVAFARANHILICHDNPYSLVLNQNDPFSIHNIEDAAEAAIELNSLSKSHNMAGWRVGMVSGREDYLQTVFKVKSNMDSGMFLGTQKAAVQALQNTPQWHEERNAIYRERKAWVQTILDELGFVYNQNQEGLFVWAWPGSTERSGNIDQFLDKLLYEKHIFFTPGHVFGENGKNHIRASLCVPLEQIKKACKRIKD